MTKEQKQLLRAIADGLQAPRNQFGRHEQTSRQRLAMRDAAQMLGLIAKLPHGGLDFADQAAMLLQAMIGDDVRSMIGT